MHMNCCCCRPLLRSPAAAAAAAALEPAWARRTSVLCECVCSIGAWSVIWGAKVFWSFCQIVESRKRETGVCHNHVKSRFILYSSAGRFDSGAALSFTIAVGSRPTGIASRGSLVEANRRPADHRSLVQTSVRRGFQMARTEHLARNIDIARCIRACFCVRERPRTAGRSFCTSVHRTCLSKLSSPMATHASLAYPEYRVPLAARARARNTTIYGQQERRSR